MEKKNKILVLAPHTDDGEFGCGGTIARLIDEGKEVYYVAFSICEESVPEGFPKNILEIEVKKATHELGISLGNLFINKFPVRNFASHRQDILENLIVLRDSIKPDLVFMPSSFDVHQDHVIIFQEGRRAFKNTSILGYEFMWNNFSFNSTAFSILSEENILKKIKSIDKYESQKKRFYATEEMVKGSASFRGLQISKKYAEAFEVIRWIL
jgi:N-acetylglucosamine malate deacetylase 1